MKPIVLICFTVIILIAFVINASFIYRPSEAGNITGAWKLQSNTTDQVIILVDGYITHTGYNKNDRKFLFTEGGKFELQKEKLSVIYEFDTRQKDRIGKSVIYNILLNNHQLVADINGKKETWNRIDKGKENLAGLWHITARKQDEKVIPIHQAGPRKTIKILSASWFQWAAINPETKEFFGTGGGSYIFNNGKYIENIEFFSRDSSRVGASLSFGGKLENGNWHHSGLSSKGDPIYEVWSKVK
ncbi:MAG: rane or secreted protein [Segetibacter sp.]|nr:rane or secreted protein [Segetibacter sp.]